LNSPKVQKISCCLPSTNANVQHAFGVPVRSNKGFFVRAKDCSQVRARRKTHAFCAQEFKF
jgi:hypothetical protein